MSSMPRRPGASNSRRDWRTQCVSFRHKSGETPKCTTQSSLVVARQDRSWPTGSPPKAPTNPALRSGQDTPPGNEPPEIRDSYSGTAYFDPRFHWTELRVTTQVVSHNNPEVERPPVRKYEQARVLGGGPRSMASCQSRARPTTTNGRPARHGLELEDVLPISGRSSATSISTGRFTARMPHPGPAHPAGALVPARASRCRGLQARRLPVPARPERRVRRRLFPVTHSNQAEQRVSRRWLSRSRNAQARQSDDLD